MKRILITGANGQLGRALNNIYEGMEGVQLIRTISGKNPYKESVILDITDLEQVKSVLTEHRPHVIINCAAHTGVDLCETDEENAYKINGIGPKNLSIIANQMKATLVHISTDYVFDGKSDEAYTEESSTNPQSIYGKSKLAGESYVSTLCNDYMIIRTAWLYGDGKNFVRTMLGLSEKQEEIRVVADQKGTPTSTKELARMIQYLIMKKVNGVFHGTCEGSTTWAEFAKEIMIQCSRPTKIIPITTSEYPTLAKRPENSILENKHLKDMGEFQMKHWKDALIEYLSDENLV